MEDKKNLELVEETRKPKTEWTAKKVITTIIIAILALLMIGGLYYIVILVEQGTDESNVFGKWNGKPVKYEANSIFYNTLNGNSAYQTALENKDYNTVYSAWYQAFQTQVIFDAVTAMSKNAGIRVPQKLVDRLIIESATYAPEDGSSKFDEDVYNKTPASERATTYQYYQKMYPYFQVIKDFQTVVITDAEKKFVSNLSTQTRDIDYYVVDFNVYPNDLAKAYDISEMKKSTDSEGKEVEPTLPEIKAYIYSKNADLVKPYIEEAIAKAKTQDFYEAAKSTEKGLVKVEKAVNNVGSSSFIFNGVESCDPEGYLASVWKEDLAKEIFTASVGYETAPIAVSNGYIVAKVVSTEADSSNSQFVEMMFNYYNATQTINNLASTVLNSPKFENKFVEKFMPILLSQMGVQQK